MVKNLKCNYLLYLIFGQDYLKLEFFFYEKYIQIGTSTNIGPTNIGCYKGRTVQTSDRHKRRTETNVGLVQTSDSYVYKEKRRTLVEIEKKTIAIRIKLKNHSIIVRR